MISPWRGCGVAWGGGCIISSMDCVMGIEWLYQQARDACSICGGDTFSVCLIQLP